MDNDISHAVQEEIDNLKARVDALEEATGTGSQPKEGEEEEDSEAEVEPVAAVSRRGGRRSYVTPTVEEPSSIEGETL